MYKVLGFRNVRYTRKNDGKEVRGTELYVVSDSPREGVTGYECDKLWLSERTTYCPTVNDVIIIYYNKYGSIDEVISQK